MNKEGEKLKGNDKDFWNGEMFANMTEERASRYCKQTKKSLLTLSIFLLLVSFLVLLKWKIAGIIFLISICIFYIYCFVSYCKVRKKIYSRINNKKNNC